MDVTDGVAALEDHSIWLGNRLVLKKGDAR